jgi:hypothetical protein
VKSTWLVLCLMGSLIFAVRESRAQTCEPSTGAFLGATQVSSGQCGAGVIFFGNCGPNLAGCTRIALTKEVSVVEAKLNTKIDELTKALTTLTSGLPENLAKYVANQSVLSRIDALEEKLRERDSLIADLTKRISQLENRTGTNRRR